MGWIFVAFPRMKVTKRDTRPTLAPTKFFEKDGLEARKPGTGYLIHSFEDIEELGNI